MGGGKVESSRLDIKMQASFAISASMMAAVFRYEGKGNSFTLYLIALKISSSTVPI
jgi:hypothetical protein